MAVHDAEVKITFAESMYGFSKKKTDATQINALREQHKQDPNHFNRGVTLALALDAEGYGIERQRLTTKLLASCRRVNGPNHDTTKHLERINAWQRDVRVVKLEWRLLGMNIIPMMETGLY